MNLPEPLRNVLAQVFTASPWALVLTKATLLLAVAWLIHVGLARANPRWRTLLWRGTVVGLVLMALWTLGLPSLEIHIRAPESLATAVESPLRPVVAERESAIPGTAADDPVQDPASVGLTRSRQTSVEARPEAGRSVESSVPSWSWRRMVFGIWCLGVILLMVRLATAYAGLASLLRASEAVPDDLIAGVRQIAVALGCRRTVQVRSSRQYAVPFLYGLRRPVLVLPERMCHPAYRDQLRGVIAHELGHVGACDFGWNLGVQVVSMLLWFHPLAWRMSSAHRAACDAVCDAVSASYLGDVQGYCRTLARVALEGAASFPAAGLAMARTCDVRRRIAALQQRIFAAALGRRTVIGVTLVGLASLALLAGLRLAVAAEESPRPEPIPLHGTVVDVHGTPLAGATVFPLGRNAGVGRFVINGVARYLTPMAFSELLERESRHGRMPVLNGEVKKDLTKTSTDAQGHFQLEESPDGPFHVGQSAPLRIVTADGHTYDVNALVARETIVHVPTLLNVKVRKVENVGVGELAGVVIDENGRPLEGVDVDVWDWFPGNETRTDEDGVFRLKGFDRDQKVEVRFRKSGYSPETLIDLPTGVSGWVLVLGKKTYFEGIVRGPDGKAVPHALVRADQGFKNSLRPGGMFTNIWTETTADDAGHFRLYVQPDRYQFLISAPGVGVSRFSVESIGYGSAPLHLDFIKLQPGVTFRAKVVDAQTSKPVQGLQLAPVNWQRKGLAARSDSDGLITIADLFPGEFQFAVKAGGDYTRWWSESATKPWQRKSIQHQPPGEPNLHWQRNFDYLAFVLQPNMEPVKIVVERGVRIRGRVIDPDGKPVAGATVAPALTGTGNSLTGDARFSVTTKADGTFDMLLPASNEAQYNLIAHDGNYEQWRNWANGVLPPIHTQPGQQIDNVVLTLTRPAVVRGKVVDHEGKPLAYCDVRAHAADKLENRYYDPTTRTNPDGTFELKFVRPGEQFIQAAPFYLRAEQAPPASTKRMTVVAGRTLGDVLLTSEKAK